MSRETEVAGAEVAAIIGGVAAAVSTLVMGWRNRQDIDVDEMRRRISSLDERVDKQDLIIKDLRSQLVQCESNNFALRRTLANNGIALEDSHD